MIAEDYGMLHFQRAALDPRDFWHQGPTTFGARTGTDLFIGRHMFGILSLSMKLENGISPIDYIVVDTLRVPRETFAAILEAFRSATAILNRSENSLRSHANPPWPTLIR